MSKQIFGKLQVGKSNDAYTEDDLSTAIDYGTKFNSNYKKKEEKKEETEYTEADLATNIDYGTKFNQNYKKNEVAKKHDVEYDESDLATNIDYGTKFNTKYSDKSGGGKDVQKKMTNIKEEDDEETKEAGEITSFLAGLKVPTIPNSKLSYKPADRLPTRPRKVYKGTYAGSAVIIKEFDVVDEDEDMEAFKKEVKIMKTLGPKVTVNLLGCAVGKYPLVYIVTEYFDHIALDSQIAKDIITLDEAKRTAGIKKVNEIYKTLEESKIVHMQLNPAHILINSKLDVRICGFTKAQILSSDSEPYKGDINKLLWRYTAPEVLKDKIASSKADCYSFGILLIELFSGQGFLIDLDNFKVGATTSKIEENKSLLDLPEFSNLEGKIPNKNIYRFAKQLLNVNPAKRMSAVGLSRVLTHL